MKWFFGRNRNPAGMMLESGGYVGWNTRLGETGTSVKSFLLCNILTRKIAWHNF